MGDWVDKGLERTGEGINIGPRAIMNGLDKVAKRAVMD